MSRHNISSFAYIYWKHFNHHINKELKFAKIIPAVLLYTNCQLYSHSWSISVLKELYTRSGGNNHRRSRNRHLQSLVRNTNIKPHITARNIYELDESWKILESILCSKDKNFVTKNRMDLRCNNRFVIRQCNHTDTLQYPPYHQVPLYNLS